MDLFAQVCEAIQHAHQKGLLHRDIKPSNVLVTELGGKPHVKVIDFGLVKVFEDNEIADHNLTQQKTALGTPLWISPEQAQGKPVDTRADIYSLGCLLYQLLTNTTPLAIEFYRTASPFELIQAICDEVPVRPSRRCIDDAESRKWVVKTGSANSTTWSNRLKDDIDWIVMKSLEKGREQRYPTVGEFSNDIRRFLDGDAVTARSPSFGYQFKTIVRKNRALATAVALVATTLIAATIASMLMANWAMNERAVAKQEGENAKQQGELAKKQSKIAEEHRKNSEQIVMAMLDAVDDNKFTDKGKYLHPEQAKLFVRVHDQLKDFKYTNPKIELEIRHAFIAALAISEKRELAVKEQNRVIELIVKEFGPDSKETLADYLALFNLCNTQDDRTKKASAYQECRRIARVLNLKMPNSLFVGTKYAEANLLLDQSKHGEVIKLLSPLLQNTDGKLDETNYHVIRANMVLQDAYNQSKDYEKACDISKKVYESVLAKMGPSSRQAIGTETIYTNLRVLTKDPKLKSKQVLDLILRVKQLHGNGLRSAQVIDVCVNALINLKEADLALPHALKCYETCSQELGENHWRVVRVLKYIVDIYRMKKDWIKELNFNDKRLKACLVAYGEEHQFTAECYFHAGRVRSELKMYRKLSLFSTRRSNLPIS